MSRAYTRNDCSVFSYDVITGLRTYLGDGTIEGSCQELENSALLDVNTDFEPGPITWTASCEVAGDTDGTSWFTKVGDTGALVFTSTIGTISGTFGCISASLKASGAMRWDVKFKGKGTITPG